MSVQNKTHKFSILVTQYKHVHVFTFTKVPDLTTPTLKLALVARLLKLQVLAVWQKMPSISQFHEDAVTKRCLKIGKIDN